MDIMTGGVRLLQGNDLGVIEGVVIMRAFAEDGLGGKENTADCGVRRSECGGVAGEL
jgi:hypothetical protein